MELRGWDFGGVAVRSGRAGVELEGTFAAAAAAAAVRSASLVSTHAHFSTCDDEHLEGGGKGVAYRRLCTVCASVHEHRGRREQQSTARSSCSWHRRVATTSEGVSVVA